MFVAESRAIGGSVSTAAGFPASPLSTESTRPVSDPAEGDPLVCRSDTGVGLPADSLLSGGPGQPGKACMHWQGLCTTTAGVGARPRVRALARRWASTGRACWHCWRLQSVRGPEWDRQGAIPRQQKSQGHRNRSCPGNWRRQGRRTGRRWRASA